MAIKANTPDWDPHTESNPLAHQLEKSTEELLSLLREKKLDEKDAKHVIDVLRSNYRELADVDYMLERVQQTRP